MYVIQRAELRISCNSRDLCAQNRYIRNICSKLKGEAIIFYPLEVIRPMYGVQSFWASVSSSIKEMIMKDKSQTRLI